ncbi:MAG: hypothetical protein KBD63_07815, partial [Bacteriovoracaceae bacterium]|nr:hypothetical protein [Bacteriovoracaceae bacterium]
MPILFSFVLCYLELMKPIFLLFFLLSCSFKNNSVLTFGLEGDIKSLDPARAFEDTSLKIINQSYETLFEYHYLQRPYKVLPLLAEDFFSIDPTGTIYTLKIKKEILYHNDPAFKGKERFVKAQDFINQIKRLAFKPLKSSGTWMFQNKLIGFDRFAEEATTLEKMLNLNIEGLSAPDDFTLVFKFYKPFPELKYLLTMSFVVPIPEEAIYFYQNNFDQHLVGTGPFELKEWKKEKDKESITYQRFKKYRGVTYPSTGDVYANENELLRNQGKTVQNPEELN